MKNVYRMNKIMLLLGGWFAAFGVLILAAGVIIVVQWVDFSKTCESTEAIITDIYTTGHGDSRTHHVVVDYEVDGEIYSNSLGYYTSSLRRGQKVTVYYNPENPYDTMNRPYAACAAIAVFFLIFGGIGFGFLFSEFRNKKIINRLAEEDKYIILDSRTERREVRAGVKVNNVRYVRTDFIYRDQFGGEFVFSSVAYPPGKCPFDPWQSVTVYVDMEKNPKKYYVCPGDDYFSEDRKGYFDAKMKY